MKKLLIILTLSLAISSQAMFRTAVRNLAYRAKDNGGRYCIGEIYLNNAKNTKIMVWAFESGKQEQDYWYKNERGSWVKVERQDVVFKKTEKK